MHDTCQIQRDTFEDTYLEPYLRGRLDTPKPPRYVSRMYPACIPHVSRMSQFISDTSLSGCIWDTCILDVSRMYLDHPCRYMYLACIPNVSCISDTYLVMTHPRYMYREFLNLGVSWCIIRCIVMKSPRYTYPDVHVSCIPFPNRCRGGGWGLINMKNSRPLPLGSTIQFPNMCRGGAL